MWTKINHVYATPHGKNGWAHLDRTRKWHRVATTSADGVTNVMLLLGAAKADDRQAHVNTDASGHITNVYV